MSSREQTTVVPIVHSAPGTPSLNGFMRLACLAVVFVLTYSHILFWWHQEFVTQECATRSLFCTSWGWVRQTSAIMSFRARSSLNHAWQWIETSENHWGRTGQTHRNDVMTEFRLALGLYKLLTLDNFLKTAHRFPRYHSVLPFIVIGSQVVSVHASSCLFFIE